MHIQANGPMASFSLHLVQKSSFFGQTELCNSLHKPSPRISKMPSIVHAEFNLFQIMGGRGLCNGEQGLQQELKKTIEASQSSTTNQESPASSSSTTTATEFEVPENAFEKELLGLTGGFPGGEKGLNNFIEKNPPPSKLSGSTGIPISKPKLPQLPLLMPGMVAIVKNPNNPYYMYCGIIQRITDGKAGVLFEGGNWDRLITFRLDELERREKGPPMVNPKSAVLESLVQKDS